MEKKTVWLSTFRYVVPADFENCMETMALNGWNVERIGQWSSIKMDFIKTEPKKYRYVFDINVSPKKDYKDIYEDFGWEFVGQMASCFIWRKEYTDERPESFTDIQSLKKRNRTVRNAVMVSFILFLLSFLVVSTTFIITLKKLQIDDIAQCIVGMSLSLLFVLYLGWVIKKINKNINR